MKILFFKNANFVTAFTTHRRMKSVYVVAVAVFILAAGTMTLLPTQTPTTTFFVVDAASTSSASQQQPSNGSGRSPEMRELLSAKAALDRSVAHFSRESQAGRGG